MAIVIIGALLVIAGVVLSAIRTIRHGRLSEPPDASAKETRGTLEPSGRGRRLSFKADLPGIMLFSLGVILLIMAGA